MTLVRHELRQGAKTFVIWTGAVGFLLAVCIFLFPEMKGQMESVNDVFSSMGSFTAAFGMDRLNFGTLIGFYAVECGNILGLGGAFYAALCAVSILSKEEKEHTAEFLLAHPISRTQVVWGKLAAVLLQITAMNLLLYALTAGCVAAIGEVIPWKELTLLHLAYYLLQLELAGVCLGISAFLHKSGLGAGLGLAAMLYFLELVANITDKAEFLRYFTPFGYTEGADIIENGCLDTGLVVLGMAVGLLGILAAFVQYGRKDLR